MITTNSYYDDIKLIGDTLKRVEPRAEENEQLFESFKFLSTIYEEFEELIKNTSPLDKSFIKAYKQLCAFYISFENIASKVDDKCRTVSLERAKVSQLSFMLLDERSSLIKANLFVGEDKIPPTLLSEIKRLWEECNKVGFYLNVFDKEVILEIEECLNSLQ